MKYVNSLKNEDRQLAVLSALKLVTNSGQYTEGNMVFKLERQFSALMRGKYSIAFNSAGSALYTAYRYYYDLGHRHIAIQNNSFYANGAMALEAGLRVYLVDSSPDCPSMGVDALRKMLEDNKQITMVLMAHVGGWMAKDYASIANVCMDKNLVLIEDCSDIIGAQSEFETPGMFGETCVWSLYPTTAVPAGDGGVLTTVEGALRTFSRSFHNFGKHLDKTQIKYGVGFDLRMSEWAAAVATVQMENLSAIFEARKRDAQALSEIAPCMLVGATNYSKYPVDLLTANKRHTTASMYEQANQLAASLNPKNVLVGNLPNSARWGSAHKCLPLGEGLYDGMSKQDLEAYLRREV